MGRDGHHNAFSCRHDWFDVASSWRVLDTLLGVTLVGLALATRAAYRVEGYYSLDSGLLALGVTDYDFDAYRPHPPYYPLTIALARVLALAADPLAALTWLAIGAAGVTVLGTYVLGRHLAGRGPGVLAASIVLASPVALRNGSVPLSYSLEGAAAVLVAWAAWSCHAKPSRGTAVLLGIVASLAVGARPSSLVLLAPLVLWAGWKRSPVLLWSMAAGALATAAWLVPSVWAGGGWEAFRFGLAFQSRLYILARPVWVGGWDAVATHAEWLLFHLRRSMPFVASLGLAAAIASLGVVRHWARPSATFLVAWIAPGLAFYLFVYAGWPVYPDGYLMALIPGLAILAALLLRSLLAAVTVPGVALPLRVAGVAVVMALAAQPLAWPAQWNEATADGRRTQAWDDEWAGFEDLFPANDTALLGLYTAPWIQLRAPDHLAWFVEIYQDRDGMLQVQVEQWNGQPDKSYFANIRDGVPDEPHRMPSTVRRVLLVDGHPFDLQVPLTHEAIALQTATLPSGRVVHWFDAAQVHTIEEAISWTHFTPSPPSPDIRPPAV